MISGMKTIALFLIGAFVLVSSGTALAALTTKELTRLKTVGLGEDVIRLMIENGYDNVDRVVELKEAGFTDETISLVIRSDLKGTGEAQQPTPQPEKAKQALPVAEPVAGATAIMPEKAKQAQPAADAAAIMQTPAKVKIEHYLVLGDPIMQNQQEIRNATVSLLEGRRLKIEWDDSKAPSTLGTLFLGKPFASPFYWDLEKGDGLVSVNPKDNSFILRTGRLHQGKPTVDMYHSWIVYLTPNNPDLTKQIREMLPE